MSTPEELKELGNKAFGAKKFEEAIDYYTKAIKLDATNHVFFSNRSASYSGLGGEKNLILSAHDAKECIRLSPSFVKGYYRLASAQIELKEYDAATATIQQGLKVDANNQQLLKQMRIVQQQRKVAEAKEKQQHNSNLINAAGHQLDAATSKEVQELQMLYSKTNRELNTVQANLVKTQREYKVAEITKSEINTDVPEHAKCYRSIGKMFMLQKSRNHVLEHLDAQMEKYKKQERDMEQKIQYLERQTKSQRQNIEELVARKE